MALLLLTGGCSDEPAAPAAGEARVVRAADGVPIVYEVHGQGDMAVVFVHCWGCNREFWRGQIEPVVAAGYRAVALDLPGHGDSGADRASWSVTSLAADVQAVAEELQLDRMVLVGHSMGGPVSLAVAGRDAGRVQGIICVDTLHDADFRMPEPMVNDLANRMEADYRGGLEDFVPQMFRPGADPAVIEWVIEQAVASDHPATIALMRDFPRLDMAGLFADAGVPIRCINAAPADGQGMSTAVETNRRYADFNVQLMEGVGHYPQLEMTPAFNDRLVAALAELTRGD
jgi:pimeloyl-ACP methyl ester carboxylesterase